MQKPSLGRIVLVTVNPMTNNGADVTPAVITRVWSDTMVNVRVLLDAPTNPPSLTSVTLYATREDLDDERTKRDIEYPHMVGQPMHAAYWPARV